VLIYVSGWRWLPPDLNGRRSGSAQPRPPSTQPPPATPSPLPERRSSRVYLLLAAVLAAVIVFRAAYEQIGNTVALWADSGIDRWVGARTIPMTWFPALNSLLVFVLMPIFVAHWARLARLGREPSPTLKMSRGAATVALSYLLLAAVSAWSVAHGVRASWLWLAAFFVLLTAGELYILPVGLALFGLLAPPRLAATLMATWFSAICLGNLLAGSLGTLWTRLAAAGFFMLMAAVAATSALALRVLDAPVRAMEAGARTQRIADNAPAPAAAHH
jgi:proton-dependent oligopeptide transporter, POT family